MRRYLWALVFGGLLAPDASARSDIGTTAARNLFDPGAKSSSLELPVTRGMAEAGVAGFPSSEGQEEAAEELPSARSH